MTMRTLVLAVLLTLAWATVSDAQTRCTYRCSGRVCWVECT